MTLSCLLGHKWVFTGNHVFFGNTELFTWKCASCGKALRSTSDKEPIEDVACIPLKGGV